MTVEYLTRFTNSSYENILVFNFYGFTINESVLGSVPGEQRKWGLKLFGLGSPRGDFKLKTTLHGGLKVNG